MARGNPNWIKAKEARLAQEPGGEPVGHVIEEDGTYTNPPAVATAKVPRPGEVFKTKNGHQYQVMHLDFGGVYVYGYPHARQPRVQDCDFWEMDKFLSERADG